MDTAIVGTGRVGTALATLLSRAGHRIAPDPAHADAVFITTPDDRIADACSKLAATGAFRPGQFVAHASGAVRLDALASAKEAGALVASLHPLQTFPDVDAAIERVPGSAMAITAEDEAAFEIGERLARDVGARPFRLADELKPLYHAAAVFTSNYVVAAVGLAERLFETAGLDEPRPLLMPLLRSTVEAIDAFGPAAALTGPAARGDAGTIEANLQALKASAPDALPAYLALADAALDLAERSGRLSPEARRTVEEALSKWR